MNEVAISGASALQALKANLTAVRRRIPDVVGTPFLRLLRGGEWVFGREDNALPDGTEVVVNPMSVRQGFSCWTDRPKETNQFMGEDMRGLGEEPVYRHDLPVYRDPASSDSGPLEWREQMSFEVKVLTSKYEGQSLLYKTTAAGALPEVAAVLDAITAQLDAGSPFVCPIVTLGADKYDTQSYKRIDKPVFEIVGWMDLDGNEEGDDGGVAATRELPAPEPEPEPAPTRHRRAAPAPEPAPEPEPEPEPAAAPVRRRRRV